MHLHAYRNFSSFLFVPTSQQALMFKLSSFPLSEWGKNNVQLKMWIMTSITLSKYYMASWLYVQIEWFTIKALLLLKFKTIVITHPCFLESIVVTSFLVMYIFNKQSEAVSRARRKGATKVFKHGRKSPLVPTLTGPFPKGEANAASWLGTKNGLYHCAQSANSFSWVLFVSSYTTAIISPQLPGSFTKLS